MFLGVEKRKYERFSGGGGAFAAFIRPNEPIIVGKIENISQSGLKVLYLAASEFRRAPYTVKIFGATYSDHLARIESSIVYDAEVPEESWSALSESWSALSVRRCGVKFEHPVNPSSLKSFIAQHFTDDRTRE